MVLPCGNRRFPIVVGTEYESDKEVEEMHPVRELCDVHGCGRPATGEVVVWSRGPHDDRNPLLLAVCENHRGAVIGFVTSLPDRVDDVA
jgi:hypothetical protein